LFHDRRDDFRAALEKRGVQSGVHYPKPVHLQPAYAWVGVAQGTLPNAEKAAATEISLPMFPELADGQVEKVIDAVKAVAAELSSRRPPVPIRIPIVRPDLGDPEVAEASRVIRSGWITQGPEVAAFEKEFAQAVGAPEAVAVANCTVALELALRVLGVRP